MNTSMQKYNIEESIIDVFCSCITDWLNTGLVDPSKCNYRYNPALFTQRLVGWCHALMGKLSGEWLILQPRTIDTHVGNKHTNYIWGALLVGSSLKSYIELWEQRSKDAHSPEALIHVAK